MDTLWEKVKKNLVEWYGTAYDKTDELARIGKKKIEVAGINRAIEKHLAELGGQVYDLITVQNHRGNKTADDEGVQKLVGEIRELESQLKAKEDEIEKIKGEKAADPDEEK
jgi:translation initiation factor 2 alpha subunit (eIF-2alpha)